MPGNFAWDAELTVYDQAGRPDFERLQQRARTRVAMRVRTAARENPARLYVFDLLATEARDMRALPLRARKEHLRESFDDTAVLVCASAIVGAGEFVWEQVLLHGFEGNGGHAPRLTL
ncbi:ATP-dependent DNA ligase [Paraburkholderia atlantica]|uniref:ATP-dependent DNA ligase n=1 Tax=Paraburkholderia atlantica TaxID=2654982 RepID=UPI0012FC408A|nr:hypothetical protein [Paraburkholderia atlantica]